MYDNIYSAPSERLHLQLFTHTVEITEIYTITIYDKNFVKATSFSQQKLSKNSFHETFFGEESEFLVFPHCEYLRNVF